MVLLISSASIIFLTSHTHIHTHTNKIILNVIHVFQIKHIRGILLESEDEEQKKSTTKTTNPSNIKKKSIQSNNSSSNSVNSIKASPDINQLLKKDKTSLNDSNSSLSFKIVTNTLINKVVQQKFDVVARNPEQNTTSR